MNFGNEFTFNDIFYISINPMIFDSMKDISNPRNRKLNIQSCDWRAHIGKIRQEEERNERRDDQRSEQKQITIL